jgi:hypothetical protein
MSFFNCSLKAPVDDALNESPVQNRISDTPSPESIALPEGGEQGGSLSVALRPAPVEEQKTLQPLSLLDYCKGEDETKHDWLELFTINVLVDLIFQYSNPAAKLLTAVAHAAPDEKDNPDLTKTKAERLVTKTPSLLAHKGYVTDLAGNTFQELTPFHLAVLLGDWHMYNMMLKHMDKTTAKAQLQELLTKGVQYTDAKGVQHEAQPFSLQPLLNAYAHFKQAIEEEKWILAGKIWANEIGAAQAVVPACVAQQFCHPTRHFGKGKDTDFSGSLPRSLKTECGFWYSAAGPAGDGRIGITHAFARGAVASGVVGRRMQGLPPLDIFTDFASVQSLSDKRTEQLNTLAASLGVTMSQESSSSPRPK